MEPEQIKLYCCEKCLSFFFADPKDIQCQMCGNDPMQEVNRDDLPPEEKQWPVDRHGDI